MVTLYHSVKPLFNCQGAFYLFFDSKEEIFCEVLCEEQQKIYDTASVLMQEKPEKTGIINALKYIYREYDQNNFLYHSDSADYMILLKKLKPGQLEKICRLEEMNQRLFLDVPHLRRKISDELTTSVIYSLLELLMTVKYDIGTNAIVLPKEMVIDEFFILSSGIAGEILQKYINYGGKLAIYGDYSKYTSKPLKDFIYESNKGKDFFFVETKEEAIEKLI